MGNFPSLVKEIDTQVHEAQRDPNKMNPTRPTPRHLIIKTLKVLKTKTDSFLKKILFIYFQIEGKGGRKRGRETSVRERS